MGVEDNARPVADSQFAGVGRRQEDGHVDIGKIEDGDDRRPGGDHLAGASELILHTARANRRAERAARL